MDVYDLPTPMVLIDIARVRKNLEKYFSMAKKFGKKIWPMVKTHKSSYIARIQCEYGADGFTVGTLDEAEVLVEKKIAKTLMLGNVYVSDKESLSRVLDIVEQGVRVVLRIDNLEVATFIDDQLKRYGLELDYVVKIDTGLHRFGVKPEHVVDFLSKMQRFSKLRFVGVVTHPGHVYSVKTPQEVEVVAREVSKTMGRVVSELSRKGFDLEIVGTGSTPTLKHDIEDPTYTHLFPGNFVYLDRIQVEVFRIATLNDCALTILSTIISIPEHSDGKIAIVNVGSKYLGLDRGAHGEEVLRGFGRLAEHLDVYLVKLSEEVGIADISMDPSVRVGEKVRVIPNHACIVGNSSSYAVIHEDGKVRGLIEIDMRNGSRIPRILTKLSIDFIS
jgi:D-serine deaminase-like pyridoxal phosphate-dependent protein